MKEGPSNSCIRCGKLILAVTALLGGLGSTYTASAAVAFDNFGPGNTFQIGNGWTETGPTAAVQPSDRGISQGEGFIPSIGGYLDSITIAIGNINGNNDLQLFLCDGSGGTPGALLESWTVNGVPPWGNPYSPPLVHSATHPFVSAGTLYYLYVIEPSNEWNAWNFNPTSQRGPHIFSQNGGAYISQTAEQGAFRVTVTPVPEPRSAFFVVEFGMLLMLVFPKLRSRSAVTVLGTKETGWARVIVARRP